MKAFINKVPTLRGFRFFLNSKGVGSLLCKCILLLVLPYAYLLLCGLVFDQLLKWYFMTGFIFVSLVILYLFALALIIWAIVRYTGRSKGGAA